MPSYTKQVALEAYYSDMSGSAYVLAPEFGLDPKNKNNINYVKYVKAYSTYQWLGGINLKCPLSAISISAGDRLDYFVYNISTQSVTSSFTYSHVFQNYGGGFPQEVMIAIGMPDLANLGAGILEGFGSLTTANTVHVIDSTFRTLVLP
jgi:hypothetical protein